MSKKSRVGRSGLNFFFFFFLLSAKPEIVVPGYGIGFRYFFFEIESKEGRKTAYSRHKTASTNDGLPKISKMKYQNRIPEPGTTISSFATRIRSFSTFFALNFDKKASG
jgi:hypothetical protein